ncbi:hypothetical protein D3C72_1814160 [compost metagenome]
MAAHGKEQAQGLGRLDALHVDDLVAVGRGQVAGFAQGADQLGQHRAARPGKGAGAQRGQRQ